MKKIFKSCLAYMVLAIILISFQGVAVKSEIVNSLVSISAITVDKISPQPSGNSISIKAEGVNSSEALYRFWIYDGVAWKVVQDYSTSNSYNWTPTRSGEHRIWIDIKNKNSKNDYDNYKQIFYYITPTIQDIKVDKQSPQKVGNVVNITAESKASNALYRFWIYDGYSWTVVRDYSSSNSYSWTPSKSGTHRIWVDIKTQGSNKDVESYKQIYYEILSKPYINNITTSLSSPQPAGNTINIKAEGINSSEALYRFWIYDEVAWKVVQDYSAANSYNWTPTRAGEHRIWVDIKDKDSKNDYDNYKQIFYYITPTIQVINVDKQAPQKIGSLINITAESKVSNALYRFWIYDGYSWTVVRDYSSSNSYSWTPSKSGTHRIWVDIKTQGSNKDVESYKQIYYEILSKPYINNITTSLSSPQPAGNTINIKAEGINSSEALYRFWIYDGVAWKVVQDYSAANSYNWTPTRAGEHRIWVDIKDKDSKNDYDNYKQVYYNITPTILSINTDKPSPRRIGATITITSKSNASNALYKFWIYDGVVWKVVQDYSTKDNYTWTPIKEGQYRIWVDIKYYSSEKYVDDSKEIYYTIVKDGIINYSNMNETLDYYVDKEMMLRAKPQYYNYPGWIDATRDQVKYYMDTNNFINDSLGVYQFLKLTYTEGITVEDLNSVLYGKGVLSGKGQVYLTAGKNYNVSPVYLVAHSLLETGNGTSELATGVDYKDPITGETKKVYNMYGIGAYDEDPTNLGAKYAYEHGWFTVDEAITKGAEYISKGYINNLYYKQDTLYKMRWELVSMEHQYATDVAWAYKQTRRIKDLVDKMKNSMFYFDIPIFKN